MPALSRPMADWAVHFPVTILKDTLTARQIEQAAGRLQAQAATVRNMNESETMAYFLREMRRDPTLSISAVLGVTYKNTGKTAANDGTQVGSPVLFDVVFLGCVY